MNGTILKMLKFGDFVGCIKKQTNTFICTNKDGIITLDM